MQPQRTSLKVLFVDDSADDAQLLEDELRRAGFLVESRRVDDEVSFREAIVVARDHVVLCDWFIPGFGAERALAIVRELNVDLPFIILSGQVGEAAVVDALRAGAHDFVTKQALTRLVPAIEREVREHARRKERAEVETERKRLESQLITSERLASLGALAAGIAHEINNPLVAIVANLELALDGIATLREHGLESDELSEIATELTEALEASERVRFISRDLRSFARPDEEDATQVDVRAVMASTLRLARHAMKSCSRVVFDDRKVPLVAASEPRLGQVFLNLLVNAGQAFEQSKVADGEIHISFSLDGTDRVLIEIADNGPGIAPEIFDRIFTPFFTTKPGVGTGLGLSISRRIITSMGGELSFEKGRARGACFHIRLPVAKGAPAERKAEAQVVLPKRGRVLVIDEDPLVGSAIQRMFAPVHEVETLSSGGAAIERVRSGERFDLILSDIEIAEEGSVDLYRELMDFAPEQAARIAFLTRGVPNSREKRFLDQIPNARLEKPFDMRELRALLTTTEPSGAS